MDKASEDMAAMIAYEERFGPIPDVRAMSTEDASAVPDKAREALLRDEALTPEEWGSPTDVPDDAMI